MTKQTLTFKITFTRDTTVKLRARDLRRLVLERAADRFDRKGAHGQQPTLSVSRLEIWVDDPLANSTIMEF